jgi:hypothetical protein
VSDDRAGKCSVDDHIRGAPSPTICTPEGGDLIYPLPTGELASNLADRHCRPVTRHGQAPNMESERLRGVRPHERVDRPHEAAPGLVVWGRLQVDADETIGSPTNKDRSWTR